MPPDEFDEYRLVERLGVGNMGAVYLAHDRLLDRAVAIKFLKTSLTETTRQRFVIEARAAARIRHPNVMGIHRVGELGEHPYIVSEYIRGTRLDELPVPQPWERVLELGIGMARGLAAAHRQGVLHRDIKLSNAALEAETGEVKLFDFSLAKMETGDKSGPISILGPREPRRDAAQAAEANPDETMWDPETDQEVAERGALLDSAARLDGNWQGEAALTQAGALMGTPHYMAPELWRAEPASRPSDVYALGVVLYILCVGQPPYAALSPFELGTQILEHTPSPISEAAPGVDPRLAAIIQRCLHHDPAERYSSGDALREALEALREDERHPRRVTDNPYRGLQAFQAEHRDLFFGRGAELRAVLDRLRSDPFVLVAGDSGVGKSSLCRAGVGPAVEDGAIEPQRRWTCATMTPGRHPLRSLVSALVSSFDLDQDQTLEVIEQRPGTLGWLVHKSLGRDTGRLLFIDQFEELVTIADRGEAERVGRILAQFAAGVPGVRLLATVRGDFLTRAATIPFIGDELSRAIYLLRPLSAAGIREAIVAPAEAMDTHYESSVLVDELVTAGLESSLPILQFALAELWEAHDAGSRTITAADLHGLGGVSGALARHAEDVMASLLPAQRIAAKQLLLRLVTIDDTRASLPYEELVQDDDEDVRRALEALVSGRLLVSREDELGTVYEIAHEALIRDWSNLRRWLDEAAEIRALRHRLEVAAAEWERLGRPREALWSSAQQDEARLLERGFLRPREAQFLAASEHVVTRGRLMRRLLVVAILAALALGYGLLRLQAQAQLDQRVATLLLKAEVSTKRAEDGFDRFLQAQAAAFEHYDRGDDEPAQAAWAEAKDQAQAADRALATAARELERALTLDPTREDARARLGDALLRRAELAEHRRDDARVHELIERLALYDEGGERMARWDVPARLSVATTPPGAAVALVEYRLEDDRRIATEPRALGHSPIAALELPRGSYRLTLTLDDRPPVLYPVLLGRGETRAVSVEIPPADAVPAGFVYVPAGRFLVGCRDETLCKVFYDSIPIHPVTTDAYLIARHEVTYDQWIEFLESTPPEDRAALIPPAAQDFVSVSLTSVEPDGWALAFPRETDDVRAPRGEPITFVQREQRISQDWGRMPVLAVNFDTARAHVDWLDRTGRVPGARLCTDREWERAGRGADGRLYPHGDRLEPDDANIDITYGKNSQTAGPDEIGSHPASTSPFGVQDLSGNAAEWTLDPLHDDASVLRGGCFFFDSISARLVGRQAVPPDFTTSCVGLRVCGSYPLPRPVGAPRPDP